MTISSNEHFSFDRLFESNNLVSEKREVRPIHEIQIRGAVDVVYHRSHDSQLIVGTATKESLNSVRTVYQGDTLLIEQEPNLSINGKQIMFGAGQSVHIQGNVTQCFVEDDVVVTISSRNNSRSDNQRAIVAIALPECPNIKVSGTSNITLKDIDQAELQLKVSGQGDIKADGSLDDLDANISGQGDIKAKSLTVKKANLRVSGQGNIKLHVMQEVTAQVSGQGDVVIHGNPLVRDTRVSGQGDIKFKKHAE